MTTLETVAPQSRYDDVPFGVKVMIRSGRKSKCGLSTILAIVVAMGISMIAGCTPPIPPTIPAYGVNFHCTWANVTDADRRSIINQMSKAGVKWVRIDTGWSSAESTGPHLDQWYMTELDNCVNWSLQAGIHPLLIPWRTPGWANGGAGPYTPPTNAADYANFVQLLATRYKGTGTAYEIWNEPDPSQSFFTPPGCNGNLPCYAAEYSKLLKAAYPAAKAGDPNALVALGGCSENNDAWISQIYANGDRNFFDVLTTHPYQQHANEPPNVVDSPSSEYHFTHIAYIHDTVMKSYGDLNKPIWFTEYGWSTHANQPGYPNWALGVDQQTQASDLVQSIRLVQTKFPYVTNMFWYEDKDEATTSSDANTIQKSNFGLLTVNDSPKPAYHAMSDCLHRISC